MGDIILGDDNSGLSSFEKTVGTSLVFSVALEPFHLTVESFFDPLIVKIDRERRLEFSETEMLKPFFANTIF